MSREDPRAQTWGNKLLGNQLDGCLMSDQGRVTRHTSWRDASAAPGELWPRRMLTTLFPGHLLAHWTHQAFKEQGHELSEWQDPRRFLSEGAAGLSLREVSK